MSNLFKKTTTKKTHALHFYSKTFPADTAGTPNTPNLPDCGMFWRFQVSYIIIIIIMIAKKNDANSIV